MNTTLLPLQIAALCLLLGLNVACPSYTSARSIARPDLSVEIIDGRGAQLPTYQHRGQTYVQGERGERYQIRLYNHSGRRRELVVTVDGRDVINGQEGSYQHRGYVVDPHDSVLIQGFRTSDDEVATFRFTSPSDSYSGRLGTGQNVGVIGVAVFEERARPRPRPPIKMKAQPASPQLDPEVMYGSGSARSGGALMEGMSDSSSQHSHTRSSATPRSEIGTQYGEGRYSAVEEVTFKRRSSRPQRVYTLRYDSERGLIRRGVISREPAHPIAFPAEPRYAPPPP